jgi:pimeloyl-ACP methyl ester carboxylesterase
LGTVASSVAPSAQASQAGIVAVSIACRNLSTADGAPIVASRPVPRLLISGPAPACRPRLAASLQPAAAGSEARHGVTLSEVPAVGHYLMLEDPAAVSRALGEAIAAFPGPAAGRAG